MNRTPWVLTIVSILVTLSLGVSNYVGRVGVENTPKWLRPIVEWLSGVIGNDAGLWTLTFTALGTLVTVADRVWGAHRFRKTKIQRVLDHAVGELLDGDAKTHRLSLFQAVRGWRAWFSIFGNRLWRQDERWRTFLAVGPINPFGLYLYVYVRPRKARNPYSCALFRVYRNKQRDCDGMAGLVWQQDKFTKCNLVSPGEPGDLRDVKLEELPPEDKVAVYARETNVRSTRQLRAREHYGKHFHGTIIEDSAGGKWGVLVLDSIAMHNPIPDGKKAAEQWEQVFDRYAEMLSHLLT